MVLKNALKTRERGSFFAIHIMLVRPFGIPQKYIQLSYLVTISDICLGSLSLKMSKHWRTQLTLFYFCSGINIRGTHQAEDIFGPNLLCSTLLVILIETFKSGLISQIETVGSLSTQLVTFAIKRLFTFDCSAPGVGYQ